MPFLAKRSIRTPMAPKEKAPDASQMDIRALLQSSQEMAKRKQKQSLRNSCENVSSDNEDKRDDELGTDEDVEPETVLPPKKKTEYEKYLKSKKREEQIRKYKETMIQETREERARQRAKIRQREDREDSGDSDDDQPRSIGSSPSKRVRFSVK